MILSSTRLIVLRFPSRETATRRASSRGVSLLQQLQPGNKTTNMLNSTARSWQMMNSNRSCRVLRFSVAVRFPAILLSNASWCHSSRSIARAVTRTKDRTTTTRWNALSSNAAATAASRMATTTTTTGSANTSWFSFSSPRWRRIATVIRYVRIPVVVVSVYALGYQQGVIDCTKEPVALQNQILNTVLVGAGCQSMDDVQIVLETDIRWHSTHRHHQVAAVGHKIVSTARTYVEEQLRMAMQVIKEKLPPDVTPPQELTAMEADETVQFWYQARLRLEGEAVQQQPWQYIFINSASPNAFVTEILPRRFFITTAMLNVAETPDELAVVLGHEVSHLILGHVSDTNKVETALRTLEVLLLSMDPTAGLLSVMVIGLIYAARRAVAAAYSRDNELQADELGLQLAASACYDTVAGSRVMYKMHQAATGMVSSNTKGAAAVTKTVDKSDTPARSSVVRLMDTHPPSLDRWERMQRRAMDGENYKKYEQCAGISSRFFNALWGSKEKTNEIKKSK